MSALDAAALLSRQGEVELAKALRPEANWAAAVPTAKEAIDNLNSSGWMLCPVAHAEAFVASHSAMVTVLASIERFLIEGCPESERQLVLRLVMKALLQADRS